MKKTIVIFLLTILAGTVAFAQKKGKEDVAQATQARLDSLNTRCAELQVTVAELYNVVCALNSTIKELSDGQKAAQEVLLQQLAISQNPAPVKVDVDVPSSLTAEELGQAVKKLQGTAKLVEFTNTTKFTVPEGKRWEILNVFPETYSQVRFKSINGKTVTVLPNKLGPLVNCASSNGSILDGKNLVFPGGTSFSFIIVDDVKRGNDWVYVEVSCKGYLNYIEYDE